MIINSFICGSSNRREEEDEDDDDIDTLSPCSTPKRSKRSKNPFSDRGLDKFQALLAELEEKKQKIYTQKGEENISLVQFVSSNYDNGIKPVVVKAKEKKPETNQNLPEKNVKQIPEAMDDKTTIESPPKAGNGPGVDKKPTLEIDEQKPEKLIFSWNFKLENIRKPGCYLPMVMILSLLFLAIFGRSFSILFTSIGWYLIPTMNGGGSSTSRRLKRKKKQYTRRLSSPRSVITDTIDQLSPE